jgi:hypothetical protein
MLLAILLAAVTSGTHRRFRPTGAWDLPVGYQYMIDSDFAASIARLAGPNATLHDVGAGQGLYVQFWRSCGLQVTGEDGASNIDKTTRGTIVYRDASTYSNECDPAAAVDVVRAAEKEAETFQCLKGLQRQRCAKHIGTTLPLAVSPLQTGHC